MSRVLVLLAAAALALGSAPVFAQHTMTGDAKTPKMGAATMSATRKIANATSAAPAEIAKKATIMDWPDKEGGQPKELRAGSNGWVCFPNSPAEFGAASVDDPMCMDKQWQAWGNAWMSKTQPKVSGTGIAYMLKGDRGASNTDPFATGPAAGNDWVVSPPHIMVLYEDLKMLDAFPTDPRTGGPWVMWKGTPYAHLMVPVAPGKTAKMTAAK